VNSLLFYKSWHDDRYNCLNTCLYALQSTLILISCITSHSSLSLCLMSSLPTGERLCTKLVKLFANRVVVRRNMINVYLRRETYIKSVRGIDSGGVFKFCELFVIFNFS
jgi:hypothetical protein